jgi:hypothetical protein
MITSEALLRGRKRNDGSPRRVQIHRSPIPEKAIVGTCDMSGEFAIGGDYGVVEANLLVRVGEWQDRRVEVAGIASGSGRNGMEVSVIHMKPARRRAKVVLYVLSFSTGKGLRERTMI